VFKVVLAGIAWEAALGFHGEYEWCEQCECLNGTYYFGAWCPESTAGRCGWEGGQYVDGVLMVPFAECNSGGLGRPLSGGLSLNQDGGNYKLRFTLGYPDDDRYVWEKNYGAVKPACKSLVDESLPVLTDDDTNCDITGSTCLITVNNTTWPDPYPESPNKRGDCMSCQCNREADIPDQFEVTISGVGDDDCADCSVLDGTYTLTRSDTEWAYDPFEFRHCIWHYEFPTPVELSGFWCGEYRWVHAIWLDTFFYSLGGSLHPFDRYYMRVRFTLGSENLGAYWLMGWTYTPGVGPPVPGQPGYNYPSPIDCDVTDLSLDPPATSWGSCDNTGATCLVSAV
jgi:hypothetical protein